MVENSGASLSDETAIRRPPLRFKHGKRFFQFFQLVHADETLKGREFGAYPSNRFCIRRFFRAKRSDTYLRPGVVVEHAGASALQKKDAIRRKKRGFALNALGDRLLFFGRVHAPNEHEVRKIDDPIDLDVSTAKPETKSGAPCETTLIFGRQHFLGRSYPFADAIETHPLTIVHIVDNGYGRLQSALQRIGECQHPVFSAASASVDDKKKFEGFYIDEKSLGAPVFVPWIRIPQSGALVKILPPDGTGQGTLDLRMCR